VVLRRRSVRAAGVPICLGSEEFVLPSRSADRYAMECVTTSGCTASLEFRIGIDTVEVWRLARRGAVFKRDALRAWLATPTQISLIAGEVKFSLDHRVDLDGRIAVTLPDVLMWTLDHNALESLRGRV